jgi:dolichol-phosphate mannosyltransferase
MISYPREEVENAKGETQRPDFSVVVPFLDEEEALPLLKERFEQMKLPEKSELILVSDGSTDRSLDFVEQWAEADPRVQVIVFSRNFGHQAAISAGLDFAQGKYVGVMDADLQDPPEVLLDMLKQAMLGNYDIVYGVRSEREGGLLKRIAYRMFYLIYSFLADTPVQVNTGDFCVLSRRAVDILTCMPEKLRFLRGLRSWIGLRQSGFPLQRPTRAAGKPQYSFGKLVSLAVTGITSFSIKPLRLATFMGILLCLLSFTATGLYLITFLLADLHKKVPGFTTVVILILLMNGLQFLMMGILGEYVGRIFWEVKQRPSYLIERLIHSSKRRSP